MLEWTKVLGPLVISWPVVAILVLLLFRRHLVALLTRFLEAPGGKAELGHLKIELGNLAVEGKDAVARLNRTTELMAESRLLELEITSQMFGAMFTEDQRNRMRGQMEELRLLTAKPAPKPAVERTP
jgi:hypothetical protein